MNVKNEICKAFNSRASHYERAAIIQQEIGERLFERLDYLLLKPRYILDLGCGPGYFSKRLKKHYPNAQIVGIDMAYHMLKEAKTKRSWRCKWPLVNADMMNMPFPSGLFDLVFANQVIHWSESLAALFSEINRIMNVNGCVMFSTLGPDTFRELRQNNLFAHANVFHDMHDIGDSLMAERFLDPVMDMDMITAHYSSFEQLLQSLKAQGVRNINPNRNPGLTGRQSWKTFEQEMSLFRTTEGKFPLTYEVVYGQAWKGEQRRLDIGTETMIPIAQIQKPKK